MSPRALQITVIVVSWFLTLGFLFSGGMKLIAHEMQVQNFENFGYPMWFMYLIGGLEVLAAVLIFLPPTRLWGALLIIVIMIGAIGTHLWHEEWVEVVYPGIPLVLAAFVAWQRRPGKRAAERKSLRRPIA